MGNERRGPGSRGTRRIFPAYPRQTENPNPRGMTISSHRPPEFVPRVTGEFGHTSSTPASRAVCGFCSVKNSKDSDQEDARVEKPQPLPCNSLQTLPECPRTRLIQLDGSLVHNMLQTAMFTISCSQRDGIFRFDFPFPQDHKEERSG